MTLVQLITEHISLHDIVIARIVQDTIVSNWQAPKEWTTPGHYVQLGGFKLLQAPQVDVNGVVWWLTYGN